MFNVACIFFLGYGTGITAAPSSPTRRPHSPDHPNPALAITKSPSPAMERMGWALRALLLTDNSKCLIDRKVRIQPHISLCLYPAPLFLRSSCNISEEIICKVFIKIHIRSEDVTI